MDDHELRRTIADWLGLPTGETTLQVHDALWKRLGERDAWKQSAEVAAAASASHCRLAMEMQRQRDAANAERAAWVNLFGCIAKNLKCLPSMFVDGNEHVAAKAASVMAERDAARAEATRLREALEKVAAVDVDHGFHARDLVRAALAASRTEEGCGHG